jgi:hypothetical protein
VADKVIIVSYLAVKYRSNRASRAAVADARKQSELDFREEL